MSTAARAFALTTAAFAAFSIARGDRRVFAYLLVLACLSGLVAVAHRRRPISAGHAWALAACGTLHLAGGLGPGDPVLYEEWVITHVLKFDQMVHFLVTALLTTVWIGRTRGRIVLSVSLALAVGIGNEIFEYISALRYADALIGDFTNASWDLVFNVAGALTAAALHVGIPAGRPASAIMRRT